MKKLIALILIAGTVTAGVLYYTIVLKKSDILPSDILPEDTLVTISLLDLENDIDNFTSDRFGQNISKIDMNSVLNQLGAPAESIESYKKAESEFISTLKNPLFKSLFGKEIIAGLTQIPDFKNTSPGEFKEALGGVVLISRPKQNADLLMFAGSFIPGSPQITTENYKGHDIRSIEISPEMMVYVTNIEGLLLASFSPDTVKKSIELREAPENSLSENPEYKKITGELGDKALSCFIYINPNAIIQSLVKMIPALAEDTDASPSMTKALSIYKGFRSLAIAAYDDGTDVLVNKQLVSINKDSLPPYYEKMYSRKPEINKTISYVPPEALLYLWTNTIDLKSILEFQFDDKSRLDALKTGLSGSLGVDTNHLIDAFGNEVAFLLKDINTSGMFPIPHLSLISSVKNKEIFETLFYNLGSNISTSFDKEEFQGIEITSVSTPFGDDLTPAYAFSDEYCIVSSNRKLVEEMISSTKGGKNLSGNLSFQSVNKSMTKACNNVLFIKSDNLIDRITKVMGWGVNMMAFQGNPNTETFKILVSEIVTPLSEGLKYYQTIGSSSLFGENGISTDTYVKVER